MKQYYEVKNIVFFSDLLCFYTEVYKPGSDWNASHKILIDMLYPGCDDNITLERSNYLENEFTKSFLDYHNIDDVYLIWRE